MLRRQSSPEALGLGNPPETLSNESRVDRTAGNRSEIDLDGETGPGPGPNEPTGRESTCRLFQLADSGAVTINLPWLGDPWANGATLQM
jgi:hypothetical protein